MKKIDGDIEIVRNLLENGRYFLNDKFPAHKKPFGDDEWMIDKIYFSYRYRNDTKKYLKVDIFSCKLDNERCFKNGYLYTTSRTLKKEDLILQRRKLKINKLLNERNVRNIY